MERKTILISGASVAGPALAYWLHRFGFTPIVVERAEAPREGGQAVDLRGAARAVLERMGILDEVRALHTGVRGAIFLDGKGAPSAVWPAGASGDSGGLVAELEILRGDLVRTLYERTRHHVEYRFGDSIRELAETADGVEVAFEKGQPQTVDLVVGADGIRSRVRQLAFGPDEAFMSDLGYYQAVFATRSTLPADGWQRMYSMPARPGVGGRMASIYPTRRAEARGMLFFAAPARTFDRRDPQVQRRFVADAFAGEGWELPTLLESMWRASDFYFDRASKVTLPRWTKGRVALVGDAAWGGSVGMGTSLAIVGAYVLAGELAAAGGNAEVALPRYEAELREFVRQNTGPMPGGLDGFLPPSRARIWFRNQVMRLMLASPWRQALTGGMQEAANAIALKAYA